LLTWSQRGWRYQALRKADSPSAEKVRRGFFQRKRCAKTSLARVGKRYRMDNFTSISAVGWPICREDEKR
jgi:hypothetical protein